MQLYSDFPDPIISRVIEIMDSVAPRYSNGREGGLKIRTVSVQIRLEAHDKDRWQGRA